MNTIRYDSVYLSCS